MKKLILCLTMTAALALSAHAAPDPGKAFDKADTNGDGMLSKDEYTAMASKKGAKGEKGAKKEKKGDDSMETEGGNE